MAEEQFNDFIDSSFPEGSKRTRSALIRHTYADRIVGFLKTAKYQDKFFRHFVKKSVFQLLDLPEAGLRDVLMVKVQEAKQV